MGTIGVWQFSLAELLVIMTAVAVLAAVVRETPFLGGDGWIASFALVASSVIVALVNIVLWSLSIHWLVRLSGAMSIAILLGVAMALATDAVPIFARIVVADLLIQSILISIWLGSGAVLPAQAKAPAPSRRAKLVMASNPRIAVAGSGTTAPPIAAWDTETPSISKLRVGPALPSLGKEKRMKPTCARPVLEMSSHLPPPEPASISRMSGRAGVEVPQSAEADEIACKWLLEIARDAAGGGGVGIGQIGVAVGRDIEQHNAEADPTRAVLAHFDECGIRRSEKLSRGAGLSLKHGMHIHETAILEDANLRAGRLRNGVVRQPQREVAAEADRDNFGVQEWRTERRDNAGEHAFATESLRRAKRGRGHGEIAGRSRPR